MTTNLTDEELLHIAIEAARRGDHGAAISYLKDGIARFADNPKLAYLLGAEYAQIGLYDQAEVEMERALQLEPQLFTACFQLGLLKLSQAKLEAANTTWQRLDVLPAENPLQLFRKGLLALAEDKYPEARALLQQGIAANDFSPDLNRDMQNVIASMPVSEEPVTAQASTEHVWLSAYRTEGSDGNKH